VICINDFVNSVTKRGLRARVTRATPSCKIISSGVVAFSLKRDIADGYSHFFPFQQSIAEINRNRLRQMIDFLILKIAVKNSTDQAVYKVSFALLFDFRIELYTKTSFIDFQNFFS